MVVGCVCGEFHELTQADMVLVITAYQDGVIATVGGKPTQILPQCMLTAFTTESLVEIARKYPKRQLTTEYALSAAEK